MTNTTIKRSVFGMASLRYRSLPRRGVALALLCVCLLMLLAFLALAIDLGMLALAQTQINDAADAAAMAATRALNGDAANDNNYAAATPASQQVVASR